MALALQVEGCWALPKQTMLFTLRSKRKAVNGEAEPHPLTACVQSGQHNWQEPSLFVKSIKLDLNPFLGRHWSIQGLSRASHNPRLPAQTFLCFLSSWTCRRKSHADMRHTAATVVVTCAMPNCMPSSGGLTYMCTAEVVIIRHLVALPTLVYHAGEP